MNFFRSFFIHSRYATVVCICFFISLFFTSCKKKEPAVPEEIREINRFIYEYTTNYYLWNNKIPQGIQSDDYSDPVLLFEDMIYHPLDRWSFVTDAYQEVLDAFDGSMKMPGYQVQFYRHSSSNELFAFVEYVYAGTPAENAGMERGDVIIEINGEALNENNYTDVLYADQMTLGLGEFNDGQIIDRDETVSITSVFLTINPVLQHAVTDTAGLKIGYLLYDQFIEDFVPDLEAAISSFEAEGVDELVLDLRFNSGGYLSTCLAFASMLVPSEYQNEVFVQFQWNDELTDYFTETEGPGSENLVLPFSPSDTKLQLDRLFVLCSGKTASASEVIINGLRPYIEVILIGDTTSGKYTGANFFYEEEADHTWGIYLVTSRIANANGETDFVNGFAPDISVEDEHVIPLGDLEEPLFAHALEIITGITAKSADNRFQSYEKLSEKNRHPVLNRTLLIQKNQ